MNFNLEFHDLVIFTHQVICNYNYPGKFVYCLQCMITNIISLKYLLMELCKNRCSGYWKIF